MPRFNYRAKDAQGFGQKGVVEATNVKQATNLLHERGFFIIDIKEATRPLFSFTLGGSNVAFNDLVHITRQLSTMITAGLTLAEALSILHQQLNKPALIKLMNQIEDEVKGGKSFALALEKHPTVFPPIYLALVKAGEASGKLDVILLRLADTLEKSRDFRNKVRGAMIYPMVILTGMLVVSIIVMTVVVPRLTSLYKEFGVSLPLPTQILIFLSNFMVKFWWLVILSAFGLVVFYLRWKETWLGKHLLAIAFLKLPVIGNLTRQSTLVEITRTLSMLIDSGVPILTSIKIAQDATDNVLYKEVFAKAEKMVEKGIPLSEPLSSDKLFPPILGQMVAVGEQTGKLGESLFKLSRYFEDEAETVVHALTTLIEPLIMVILGVGVAFLVMAVLLPIYSITSKF